jgi:hypothetical protein
MTSLMKTRLDIVLDDLWKDVAYGRSRSLPDEVLFKTLHGFTAIDAAIHALRSALYSWRYSINFVPDVTRGTKEARKVVDEVLPFIEWSLHRGIRPSADNLSSAVQLNACSLPAGKYDWVKEPHYSEVVITRAIQLLVEHGAPLELDFPPPPDEELIRANDGGGPHYRRQANEGFSPLHHAAELGAAGTTELLLKLGATPDKRSTYEMTPVMIATVYGKEEVVRVLLDGGADPTLTNCDLESPLDMCNSDEPPWSRIRDLLKLRLRYAKGPIKHPNVGYRHAELIHRTARGDLVRSKSEVIIADALFYLGCDYQYEQPLVNSSNIIPDFTIHGFSGGPIIWEHAGIMGDRRYSTRWAQKERWYSTNGYVRGVNLFVTFEDERSGMDSSEVRETAMKVKQLLQGPN